MDLDLSAYQVGCQQLQTLHYIAEFISEAEEQRLLQEVHASKAKWVQLSGRRLQNHGGSVHSKGLIPAPLPTWLQQLLARLPQQLLELFPQGQPPNHVLINSYQPGCGIMPHEDGPLYHPVVLILSLGSPAVLRFWHKQPSGGTGGAPPVASLLALPRSLLVFQDEAYTHCLHGIEEVQHELLDDSVVNTAAVTAAAAMTNGQLQQQQSQGQPPSSSSPTTAASDAAPKCEVTQPHRHHLGNTAAAAAAAQQQDGLVGGVEVSPSQESLDCRAGGVRAGGDSCMMQSQQQTDCSMCACAADAAEPACSGPRITREGQRVSLTIRRVLKVHKALGFLTKR